MKADKFDELNPPELSIIDGRSILKFNSLPPANRNSNPLYNRLEVLIGNTIGYQYNLKKSEDNLTYEISSTDEFVHRKIIELLNGFHTNQEFIRFDNRTAFITSKEVRERIKELLISHFTTSEIKSKTLTKVVVQFGEFLLTIEWLFLRGDAAREFNFNWRISSKEITNLHNEIIANTELQKSKELSLISKSQYYDKSQTIERLFDVANIDEVDKSVIKYLNYMEKEIVDELHKSITYQKIIDKIIHQVDSNQYRFPERSYYVIGLLEFYNGNKRAASRLDKLDLNNFIDKRELRKIELLKQKIASS